MSIRQPVGVAGLIVPWNSPAYLSVRALAPALAAGCAVVVKLPGQAAQTAGLMSEILGSVREIPAGIVNVVVESGSDVARLLVESPQVPVISFTGSTHTGRLVAQAAAGRFKRVGLELGGKTPHLVFADADLDQALPADRAFRSGVRRPVLHLTGSRVLVQRDIADEFIDTLAGLLENVRPGPASDPASEMGPMIDKASVTRVNDAVEAAIAAGAKAIVRGGPSTLPALSDGAFYRPCWRIPGLVAADRARRDLRSSPERPNIQYGTGGGRTRQRHRIRSQREHLESRHRSAHAGRPTTGRGSDLHQQLGEPDGRGSKRVDSSPAESADWAGWVRVRGTSWSASRSPADYASAEGITRSWPYLDLVGRSASDSTEYHRG